MTDNHTLLSFITRRYISAREDAATDALGFVLNRSAAATKGLSDLLSQHVHGISEIVTVKNQVFGADGGFPDLAGFDANCNVLALIEAKFAAPLTGHQPNTYWKRLPKGSPSALVFLAPKDRLPHLLDELMPRLAELRVELGDVDRDSDPIVAQDKTGNRCLILISWDELLGRLTQSAIDGCDQRAQFELKQIGGIADAEYDATDLSRDQVLRELIRSAIGQAENEGWVSTQGLAAGGSVEFPGRFFRLATAYAFLGINRQAWRETGKPIWLVFNRFGSESGIGTEQVREKLGSRGDTGSYFGRQDDYRVVLDLPPSGLDDRSRVQHVTDQLRDVARLIDPEAVKND